MATTINATTPRVGFTGIRAAVVKLNRFWPNTASVRLVAPSVKFKKVQAFEVLGWDPDQGDTDVPVPHSQTVNFAVVRSNALSGSYSTAQRFGDGELENLELAGAGLQLAKERSVNDFNQYPVGGLPTGDFTQVTPYGVWTVAQEAGGNRYFHAVCNSGQNQTFVSYDVEPSHINLVAQVKIKPHTADYSDAGILFRATGSGGTFTAIGIEIRNGFNSFIARRFFSASNGGNVQLGTAYMGGVVPANDGYWYILKAWINGDDLYAKCWREDSSEPGSWTFVASQTVIQGPGEVGLYALCRAQVGGNASFDDMAFESVPTRYEALGEWVSDRNPLAAVDLYSQSIISWNETLPTDTSIAVECQRDVGAPWMVCTNGGQLPGFIFDDGLKTDNLRFRVTLSSTDVHATPEFSNLQFQFIKLDWDLVEIVVDGHSSLDGNLGYWGQKKFVTPNTIVTYDDIWVQNYAQWWLEVNGGYVISEFKYNGIFIDSVSWSAEQQPAPLSSEKLTFHWVVTEEGTQQFPILAWAVVEDAKKGFADVIWVVLDRDPITGGECEYVVIDATPGLQATGSFWVAIQIFNEFVVSQLTGEQVYDEFLSSLIVNGFKRNEFVQSEVVQGTKFNEFKHSLLPAVENLNEFVASQVISIRQLSEFPASFLIYGLSSDGAIFVNVIDDETHQKLLDLGVVFS